MQLTPTAFVPTYRAPESTAKDRVYPEHRAVLRSLVAEALTGFEAVATTHDSAQDTLGRIRDGWTIREKYRPQLEAVGSIGAGEDLAGTVFAAMQFRPRGSSEPVLGIERYGEVAIHWRPSTLEHASITPWVTKSAGAVGEAGRGMRAGSIRDVADVTTDALIKEHGMNSVFREGLHRFVELPRDEALRGIAELVAQRHGFEAILRGVTPTRDAIEGVTIMPNAAPSPELDEIRAWAAHEGIPIDDQAE